MPSDVAAARTPPRAGRPLIAPGVYTPPPPVAAPERLDGRRTHIIDRALEYVALADQGLSASRIARKRRKSQGYVSIVLRLGRAIQGMEPGELTALRSPRVTWKLAQRIVRQDADAVSIRHQLRGALGGFSTHNVDGRKLRKARPRRDGTTGTASGGRSGLAGAAGAASASRAVGVAWGWDAAWFARDPVGFAEAHLRYVLGVHQTVQLRATRSVAARGVERVSVGQGLRSLQRTLAAARTQAADHGSDAERRALALLEILERKLGEAEAEIAALVPSPAPAPRPARPAAARARTARIPDDEDIEPSLEDDLRE